MKAKRLDRIKAEAQQLRFDRALLTIILAPLYLVGWTGRKCWRVVWGGVALGFAAVKVGWNEGSK